MYYCGFIQQLGLLLSSESELTIVIQYSYICNSIYYSSFIRLIIYIYFHNRIDRILIKKTNHSLSRDVWNTLFSILMAMILSKIAHGSMTHYWIRNSQNLLFNKHSYRYRRSSLTSNLDQTIWELKFIWSCWIVESGGDNKAMLLTIQTIEHRITIEIMLLW